MQEKAVESGGDNMIKVKVLLALHAQLTLT